MSARPSFDVQEELLAQREKEPEMEQELARVQSSKTKWVNKARQLEQDLSTTRARMVGALHPCSRLSGGGHAPACACASRLRLCP